MIIVIGGPTGVGKTKLSVELAKKYNGVIINSDAMQVYKEMNIATAKIKEEEKENIPHYLFDICDLEDVYTIYNYQKDARKIIDENKDKTIIIVGGSGLYQKAALYDYKLDDETINTNKSFDDLTNEELYQLALKKDPLCDVHKNNRKRLIRVLNKKEVNHEKSKLLYDNAIFIGLTTSRENLYNIINKRVDKMVDEGLINEAKYFYDKNIKCKALDTVIGYKELFKYFSGEISKEEALDLIKKNSRHYAKRQYTWYNNQLPTIWVETNYDDFSKTVDEVIKIIEEKRS
ncbi:MAG: tRNA (adenosine(37)-N6)-dimethylallyltransferase MiaA [Bacilli bacterium]|nr:tRNA (adenosine(37)-N6)-dimethylallyltransferase MiaA [Bacilli bacterium]